MIIILGNKEPTIIDDSRPEKVVYIDSSRVLFLDLTLPTTKKKLVDEMLPFSLEEVLLNDVADNEYKYIIDKKGKLDIILIDKIQYATALEKALELSSGHIDAVYPDVFLLPSSQNVVVFCFEDRILVRSGECKGFSGDASYGFEMLDAMPHADIDIYKQSEDIKIPDRYLSRVKGVLKFEDFLRVDITNKLAFYRHPSLSRLDFGIDSSRFIFLKEYKDHIVSLSLKFYEDKKLTAILLMIMVSLSLLYSAMKYTEYFLLRSELSIKYDEISATLGVDREQLFGEVDRKFDYYHELKRKAQSSVLKKVVEIMASLKTCAECKFEKIDMTPIDAVITLSYNKKQPEEKKTDKITEIDRPRFTGTELHSYLAGMDISVENINNVFRIYYPSKIGVSVAGTTLATGTIGGKDGKSQ